MTEVEERDCLSFFDVGAVDFSFDDPATTSEFSIATSSPSFPSSTTFSPSEISLRFASRVASSACFAKEIAVTRFEVIAPSHNLRTISYDKKPSTSNTSSLTFPSMYAALPTNSLNRFAVVMKLR